MNIVIPMLNADLSGGVRVILEYANGLSMRDHNVTIILPNSEEKLRFITNDKIKIEKISAFKTNIRILDYLIKIIKITIKIRKIIKKEEKIVILSPSWQSVIPAILSRIDNGKIIHLLQHDDRIINSERGKFKKFINTLLYKWTYKKETKKITVSNWLKEVIKINYNINSFVVQNGVDRSKFYNNTILEKWSPPVSTFDVMCIGRSVAWKGFHEICESIRILEEKKIPVRLIVVTHEKLNIPNDIHVLIKKPSNDYELGRIYRSSSVFVCSSWYEGFGLPPLEAMCNGVPVISTKCGGVEDYAIDNINCLLVEPKSSYAIAEALIKLKSNFDLQINLSNAAIKTAEEFSFNNALRKLENTLIYMK